MFNRIGRVLASAALLTACALGSVHAEEKVINFGIMSTESSQNLKSIWQPFLDDMSKKTGLKVNATFASDYAGGELILTLVLMQEINQAFVSLAQNANNTSALIVTFIFMRAYTTARVVRAKDIPDQSVLLKNDKLLIQKPHN